MVVDVVAVVIVIVVVIVAEAAVVVDVEAMSRMVRKSTFDSFQDRVERLYREPEISGY